MKKLISIIGIFAIILTFAACGNKDGNKNTTNNPSSTQPVSDTPAAKGQVYFLNFKPEVSKIYEEIAREYEAETGVSVKVVTAASDTYEQTLTSEIAKSNPPSDTEVGRITAQTLRIQSFILCCRIRVLQSQTKTVFTASPMPLRATALSIMKTSPTNILLSTQSRPILPLWNRSTLSQSLRRSLKI